ncbi:hypothetical protein ACFL3H_05670 [Gemmatimonadota bacterium]
MTRIMRSAAALLALLLLAAPVGAQDLQISGYYEHTLNADYSESSKELIMDASKLRLDFASGVPGGLSFNGNMNYIVYHGEISRNITPFLPPSVQAVFTQLGLPAEITLPRERLYLDNAYLTWEKGKVRFRAGKQQLAWGSAYSFSPTDLFHQKDMLDPTYEKEGVTALRFDYRWGIGGNLSLIAAPGDRIAESGYAVRLGTHVSSIGYDIAMTAHSVTDSTSFDPITWMPVIQKRRALGLEFTGSLFGLGLWFEGNYNFMETEDDFLRAAIGFDYTLNNGLYIMAETLINQRAGTTTPYPVHDWLAYLSYGEPISNQWYLVGLGKDIGDLSNGGLYLFATPDGSFVLNPRLDFSIAQNADLIIFGGITMGDDEGAFPPGYYSLVARATVWF